MTVIVAFLIPSVPGTPSPNAQRIEITAKRFEFVPGEVTLKKGVPVVLVIHSEDVAHSIVVKELNLKSDVVRKGRSTEVRFTPQTAGTFMGKCGNFCGSGHGRMQLAIHVTD